ncbi:pyridoxal phosphate-dependent enzyme, D-cysteine desulfhydrase family [Desulfitobacterium dichloroeliminans LMG P-21439]|uniref:Pyridoxal phosphate-dependent enzyme, D-cysteine desulfhydrase family n=1 Tax=Desulfitobacterium dichloroeliminans (strain LMG P-21439 / DCA1) TaxID=871963 RepID=L0F490_DESDL|nr:D-cysteine desulfhydrase [Desulfitobacterium dichloroeliminans]AGA67753.1 pyridoxal phosphate-dependent enzyme, D-cysteine desulfhydrase family [Desulfitobacterium dichloroeliminans LMG P-21439]
MNLAQFPRRRYTEGKTPLQFLPNFTEALGGPNTYIKRDDLLGLTSGGNKTRKLEFLMADALDQGADTIITCGAVQSNHCRLTLAAAVKEGLKCRLVLEERVKDSYHAEASGNNFLFQLLGVEKISVVAGSSNMMEAMQRVAEDVATEGRKAYIVPGGGSNPIGTTGYVACAQEIMEQTFDLGLSIDHIVSASGSAGTHSGLLVGLLGNNMNIPLTGISVNRKAEAQEQLVFNLANQTAERVGFKGGVPREAVKVFDEYVGPGYSLPTETMVEAVQLLARTEGILLDPVYTGKAMAGLIGLIRKGQFKKGENVLFIHTGGSPALYAYMPTILSK